MIVRVNDDDDDKWYANLKRYHDTNDNNIIVAVSVV
jgi:hypothetical protein